MLKLKSLLFVFARLSSLMALESARSGITIDPTDLQDYENHHTTVHSEVSLQGKYL